MKKNKTFKIIAIITSIIALIVGLFGSFEIFGLKIPETATLVIELIAFTVLFILGILSWVVPSKEHTLLKIIILILLYVAILSWVIPASTAQNGELMSLGLSRVSLYEFLYYPLLVGQFFAQPLLFILSVSGLYGVLTKTGKYRSMLEKIAKSMKGKEELFLIIVSLILAMISSVFGISLLLFTVIPALCGIIILMGYNKTTAFLTTFISPLIGIIGSTYGYYITGYINEIVGTSFTTEIVAKVGLFVLSFVVYSAFLIKQAKTTKNKDAKIEDDEIPFLGEKKQNKKASWPILLILGLLLILTILGVAAWASSFNVTLFTDLHKAITEWEVQNHTLISYLITDLKAFGEWYLTEITALVLLATFIISRVYNIKANETINAFAGGISKVLKVTGIIFIAYTVVIFSAYHPYIVTITDWMMGLASKASGIFGDILFIILSTINTMLSTILNVDMIYVVQSTVQYISTESTNSLAIITQAIYGLTLIVAPTSTMVILGLGYLGIPYKEWLKTSWKLFLSLLAIILLVVIVVMFI
jgi:uncharacterized ion transporter superfamily protein YfcC